MLTSPMHHSKFRIVELKIGVCPQSKSYFRREEQGLKQLFVHSEKRVASGERSKVYTSSRFMLSMVL